MDLKGLSLIISKVSFLFISDLESYYSIPAKEVKGVMSI